MRYRWMGIAALGLCAASSAEAQSALVERRGPAEVAAQPGEPLAIPFRVTNVSGAAGRFSGESSLPTGWSATGGAASELAPAEAGLRLLGVRVPTNAAAGRYVVRYAAGGSADSVDVVVAARRDVRVEPARATAMVPAGEEIAVRFRVANHGNVAERLVVRAASDGGAAARADSSLLLLPPGSERVVTVRAATERRATGSLRRQVTLYAAADGDTAAAHTLVTVVPRGGGRPPRRGLPAEVRVRAADSLSAAGFSFQARGPLDRAGRVRLDLEARTADPAGAPFRRQDEYRLRLDAPGVSLRLGDDVYRLSALTEPGRPAFGAGATVGRGLLAAGGMVARDRRGHGEGGVVGGFARVGGTRARLGVVFAAPGSAPARWTVEGAATLSPLLEMEAEAAPAPGPGATELPRSLRAWGYARWLSYELLHLRGASTRGGTGSPDQDFASIALRPAGELSLSASARRGGDFRVFGDTAATFPRAVRAGLGWGGWLGVEYRETTGGTGGRGDLRALRGRLGIPVGRARLHPAYEVGELVPAPGAAPAPFRVLSLQAAVSARGGASLWAYGQLHDGASARGGDGREWSGTISAQLPVLAGTWLRVSAHARQAQGRPGEALVDLSLERALGGGHRLTVRGLANAQAADGWRPRGFAEYAAPLRLPLPGSGGDGVTVRVFDPGTGKGIPGVLVRAADRLAVTDRRGIAAFSGLPPGQHALRVEPGAGPERVADRHMPLLVAGGEGARRVEIGLQAAARMTGVVDRLAAPGAAAVPMEGVEVEISGPGGVRQLRTDAGGRFEASGLRPGLWRVRMAEGALPRHHELQEQRVILLRAGHTTDTFLVVVQKERPVQMIQSGDLNLP